VSSIDSSLLLSDPVAGELVRVGELASAVSPLLDYSRAITDTALASLSVTLHVLGDNVARDVARQFDLLARFGIAAERDKP